MRLSPLVPASASFAWPTIAIDKAAMVDQCNQAIGTTYSLGSKAPLSASAQNLHQIDCSGFVRWLLYKVSGVVFPDGSQNQEDAVNAAGFKRSGVASGHEHDGHVRIAFYPGVPGGSRHVVLIYQGMTLESHGGKGVDRRLWTGDGWQGMCNVYVLDI